MSETPLGSDELPEDYINEALVAFTACIGAALPDICSYGLTIGESYVPFDPDEEDECEPDEQFCSQVWVRVVTVTPSAQAEGFGGECGAVLSLTLEVGVYRCFEIEGEGAAPTATQTLTAAMKSMSDMQDLYCAAMGCDAWESITSIGWQPTGPSGGQYGGIWNFTAEI